MGMGGSSLAPDVLHRTFGSAEGYLALRILDSTDPAAVGAIVDDLDPLETLWIVASKSGTTTEPLAFMADAWARVEAALEERSQEQRPGEFFAVITDPGKSIAAIPHHDELREEFLNPPDIGGRYSALTYVGLVPASLIGLDLDALLAAGSAMLALCREPDPPRQPRRRAGRGPRRPGAKVGRDKLTILADPAIVSFGAWLEQLIAEAPGSTAWASCRWTWSRARASTSYAADRVFAVLVARRQRPRRDRGARRRAGGRGPPVIRIELDDPIDVAAECIRWEVATAIAGVVLGIDAFDQPNVEEAKELTRKRARRSFRRQAVRGRRRRGRRRRDRHRGPRRRLARRAAPAGPAGGPRPPPNYVAIQAYIAPSAGVDAAIARLRTAARGDGLCDDRRLRAALPALDGPAPQGRPADRRVPPADLRPPGGSRDPWLAVHLRPAHRRAGPRRSRRAPAHDRPVIHVHLGANLERDLATLEQAVTRALA